jgi:uncharacterized protein (TIGR00730 family)
MMGELARSVIDLGGEVIGVVPRSLAREEIALMELADMRVVETMHERKALMIDLADGFIALPGGLGTVEEFFEVLTWAQLNLHSKPCGLLDVEGYYARIIDFLHYAVDEQFVEIGHLGALLIDESCSRLLDGFAAYRPHSVDKVSWAVRMSSLFSRHSAGD